MIATVTDMATIQTEPIQTNTLRTQTDGAILTVTRIQTKKTMTHSRTIHHNGTIRIMTDTAIIQTVQTLIYSRMILPNGTMLTVMA